MKLSECPSRSNNLQLLRFVSALLVVVSHAFHVCTGENTKEWLLVLTNDQFSMGGLAVSVFFCAGGYLIAKSMCRLGDGRKYFLARALRIFPALIVVVFLSAFLLGPLYTELSIGQYFKNIDTYKYLLNGGLILQHNLPGVFENNIYLPTVNGSLWTLPVEFLCYIACYIMWKFKLLEDKKAKWSVPVVLCGAVVLYKVISVLKIEILLSAIRPGLLFYIGMIFYVYRDRIRMTKKGAFISLLVMVVAGVLGVLDMGLLMGFPYLLLYVCFALPQVSDKIGFLGNLSYGIYLCGFPIQQMLVASQGGQMSYYSNMLIAIPLVIVAGYFIYYFVEKPVGRLEKSMAIKEKNKNENIFRER